MKKPYCIVLKYDILILIESEQQYYFYMKMLLNISIIYIQYHIGTSLEQIIKKVYLKPITPLLYILTYHHQI